LDAETVKPNMLLPVNIRKHIGPVKLALKPLVKLSRGLTVPIFAKFNAKMAHGPWKKKILVLIRISLC